jgi:hypothetical protein
LARADSPNPKSYAPFWQGRIVRTPGKQGATAIPWTLNPKRLVFRGEEDKEGKARQVPKDAEGGIEVVVESDPVPRVRARRCNMAEETVVKETSEGIILANLAKEIGAWVKENGGR